MIFTLDTALALAVKAHEGQKDKAGMPYILHPIRVMNKQFPDQAAMMAGILHDVVEDTDLTLDSLRAAGCPEFVVEAIDALTRRFEPEKEDYMDMIERIRINPIAAKVKIADLEDNLNILRVLNRRNLKEHDLMRLNRYYKAWSILTGK